MRKFKLCSEGKCCPEVTVKEDQVIITDDFGGKVRLTKEQFRILRDSSE